MHDVIDDAVRALRLGRHAEAGMLMVKLLDQLGVVLGSGSVDANKLVPVLKDVMEAQARGDDLCVADGLEHRLLPLLMGTE